MKKNETLRTIPFKKTHWTKKAEAHGIDLTLNENNLAATPQERINRNNAILHFITKTKPCKK
jgi:hypothetical protein